MRKQKFFATSANNICMRLANMLIDNELQINSVVKYYFTTALNDKTQEMEQVVPCLPFYSLLSVK